MDDMEADLLGMSKPSSGLGKAATKGPGKFSTSEGAVKTSGKMPAPEKGKKEILLLFPQPDCEQAWGVCIPNSFTWSLVLHGRRARGVVIKVYHFPACPALLKALLPFPACKAAPPERFPLHRGA